MILEYTGVGIYMVKKFRAFSNGNRWNSNSNSNSQFSYNNNIDHNSNGNYGITATTIIKITANGNIINYSNVIGMLAAMLPITIPTIIYYMDDVITNSKTKSFMALINHFMSHSEYIEHIRIIRIKYNILVTFPVHMYYQSYQVSPTFFMPSHFYSMFYSIFDLI